MENYFTHLKCTNFRGLIDFETDFCKDLNEISGDNGVGKTTVLSSILWCLFGKDIDNRKVFQITPIINGETRHEMTTNVELVINNSFVVNRTWSCGETTLQYGFIDSEGKKNLVKSTQTKFNEVLKEKFIGEEEFKALSNVSYLPSLSWEKLKTFIFDLIGEVNDKQVLEAQEFPLCEKFIVNFGSIEFANKLKEAKRKLNEKIKELETKIEYATQIKLKYLAEKDETERLEELKEKYTKLLNEHNEAYTEMLNAKKLKNEKEETVSKLSAKAFVMRKDVDERKLRLETMKNNYRNSNFSVEAQRNADLLKNDNEIFAEQRKLITLKSTKESLDDKLETTKKEGEELKNKEVKVEKETCIYCGSKLKPEIIEATLEKMKQQQKEEIRKIKEKYDLCKLEIDKVAKDIEECEIKIKTLENEKEVIKNREYTSIEETEEQKLIKKQIIATQGDIDLMMKEIDACDIEKNRVMAEIRAMQIPEIEEPTEIIERLNDINDKLATNTALKKIENDIEELRQEYSRANEQKDLNFRTEQELILFNSVKSDMLKKKVAKYFDLVEFKTLRERKDGTLEQCFCIAYNGIVYEELNTAQKIKVAIDLVLGIQKIKDKKVPILIDSVEVITRLPKYDTQTIITRSIKQDVPKILLNGVEV